MSARDEILNRLRTELRRPDLRFPPVQTPPLTADQRMTVTTAAGTPAELAARFGQELETLHGTYEITATAVEARLALINRILAWMDEDEAARRGPRPETGQERQVLSWDPAALPVSGVADALGDLGVTLVAPESLHTAEERNSVRFIRTGLTGVTAAFAATGSMMMAAGPETNRAASLLPFRHVALIPFSRLYPTIESWLAEQRQTGALDDLLRDSANLSMITGPSKSADIEMNLTLGVHGPKYVHAILFDDQS